MIKILKQTIVYLMIVALIISCKKQPTDPDNGDDYTIWVKMYGGNQNVFSSDILMAGDGGYFIAGTRMYQFEPDMDGDAFLIKTDVSGEVLWENTYGGEALDGASSIVYANDGNLIIPPEMDPLN